MADCEALPRPERSMLKTYLFSYMFDGDNYSLHVKAYSQAEALGRVRRMSTAVYDGEVMASVPVALQWPARAIVFVRNMFR